MRVDYVAWLWKGWRPVYDLRHAKAVYSMLEATQPAGSWTLNLATDQAGPVLSRLRLPPQVRVLPLPTSPLDDRTGVNCYRRLRLWDAGWRDEMGLIGDLVVSIDLDVIVRGNLEPLFADVITAGGIRGGFSLINGSLWAVRQQAEVTLPRVWERFVEAPVSLRAKASRRRTFKRSERRNTFHGHIGSDQAIMSYLLSDHAPLRLWGHEHGIRVWRDHSAVLPSLEVPTTSDPVLWTFPGNIKPWHAQVLQRRPDLYHYYQTHLCAP